MESKSEASALFAWDEVHMTPVNADFRENVNNPSNFREAEV